MKKAIVADIIVYLLILLFLYTGLSKLFAFHANFVFLQNAPIVQHFPTIAAISIPVIELLIAIALFIPRIQQLGLWAAFTLMAIFTAYVGWMLLYRHQIKLPCTCGGIIGKLPWRQHLLLNIAFTFSAGLAIWLRKTTQLSKSTSSKMALS